MALVLSERSIQECSITNSDLTQFTEIHTLKFGRRAPITNKLGSLSLAKSNIICAPMGRSGILERAQSESWRLGESSRIALQQY
jgi:hypothetical protein